MILYLGKFDCLNSLEKLFEEEFEVFLEKRVRIQLVEILSRNEWIFILFDFLFYFFFSKDGMCFGNFFYDFIIYMRVVLL